MRVKLKLVNQGVRNHPLFWLVAIPYRKKLNGKHLEKLGYIRPRTQMTYDRSIALNIPKIKYWLGNGAIPTDRVHKILERFDLVPHKPPPFGSKYQYEKPKKEYKEQTMKVFMRTHRSNYDEEIKLKIKKELDVMERRMFLEELTYDNVDIENAKTTDIDSDEPNILDRNIKFEEIKKRFEKHRKYSLDVLQGNDYQFNMYLRKMQKLSQSKTGGLDLDGYKDYLNNLMEFRKIKGDLLREKDPAVDDKIKIDYSGVRLEEEGAVVGHPKTKNHDINVVMSLRDKRERLESMKSMLIDILKDEIEMRRQYEAQYGNTAEKESKLESSYADNRQPDGNSEHFLHEEELIQEYNQNNTVAPNLNQRNLNFMKEGNSDISFLNEYDSTEEEITVKIIEYLYDNPHLFRKIRFLQRNNKILNLEEIPESKKLSEIKSMIINSKTGDHNDNSSLRWLRNTDAEFQESYGKKAEEILRTKARLKMGNLKNLEKLNVDELENAMKVLVEGYRRVKSGEKEVKLSDILQSVNLKPSKERTEKAEIKENKEEKSKVYEQYITKTQNKYGIFEDSRKQYEEELKNEKLKSESENSEQDAAEQQVENEKEENKEENKEEDSEEKKLSAKIDKETDELYKDIAGRYVPGFRYYENYESYLLKFPNKSIQDYINDMHREATFGEFCEIFKSAFRFYTRVNPKERMEILKKTEGKPEVLEWVLNSEIFEDKLRQDYQHRLRVHLGLKKIYTLVDCLEEFTDLVYFGDPFRIPKHGAHIPGEGAMIPFPKFAKQIDKPQPLNSLKFGPTDFLNPIKVSPTEGRQYTLPMRRTKKMYNLKYRRMGGNPLSKPRFFSTFISKSLHIQNHPIGYFQFIAPNKTD